MGLALMPCRRSAGGGLGGCDWGGSAVYGSLLLLLVVHLELVVVLLQLLLVLLLLLGVCGCVGGAGLGWGCGGLRSKKRFHNSF